MIERHRPTNYTDLLFEAVASALLTPFWRQKLGSHSVNSLADFERLPFTSIEEYRAQNLGAVVADPDGIEWIPGSWLGQSHGGVPVVEGPVEAWVRVGLMTEAVRPVLPNRASGPSALVLVDSARRHFGAEMSAVLVRLGVQAHLLSDNASDRLEELLRAFGPDILVLLSQAVDARALPESVTGIVTVGRESSLDSLRHVDLLVQNELGVLGAAFGAATYELNHHRFHFEESPEGTLAATPYFSRVQPLIRLNTEIPASVLH